MFMVNKKFRKIIANLDNQDTYTEEKIYLYYIDMLVKTENLQSKLEKTYAKIIESPKTDMNITRETVWINNCLNKLLVKIMVLQNVINFLTLRNNK